MSVDRAGMFVVGCIAALLAYAAPVMAQLSEAAGSAPQRAKSGARDTDSKPNRAKPLPRAALLATGGEAATALDPVIQAALEELEVVKIVAVPGMDLQGVQLALDCVGETTRCLKLVASRSRVQVLVSPTLSRTANEHVLSILRFDASGSGEMRRVLRRHAGAQVGTELLDDVPNMLRELFELPPSVAEAPKVAQVGVPPSAAEAPAPLSNSDAYSMTMPDDPTERPLSIGPFIVAGAGVAALGAGIAMGVVMKNNQDKYERMLESVRTSAQADTAIETRDTGKGQATAATVLLGVGGAALVAAGIWFALDLTSRSEAPPSTAFAPMIGPGSVSFAVVHRGASL